MLASSSIKLVNYISFIKIYLHIKHIHVNYKIKLIIFLRILEIVFVLIFNQNQI